MLRNETEQPLWEKHTHIQACRRTRRWGQRAAWNPLACLVSPASLNLCQRAKARCYHVFSVHINKVKITVAESRCSWPQLAFLRLFTCHWQQWTEFYSPLRHMGKGYFTHKYYLVPRGRSYFAARQFSMWICFRFTCRLEQTQESLLPNAAFCCSSSTQLVFFQWGHVPVRAQLWSMVLLRDPYISRYPLRAMWIYRQPYVSYMSCKNTLGSSAVHH